MCYAATIIIDGWGGSESSMNWIKVEPNPTDNVDPRQLPPLNKVVWVIHLADDDTEIVAFGGRVDEGEGWLWAIDDNRSGYRRDSQFNDLTTDDDYRVTHWAEIEWPE
jgi:hypothetical protein